MEGLISWLGTYGQVIGFVVQLVYYIGLVVAAFWAVLLFKRLVDFKTGGGKKSSDDAVPDSPASEKKSSNVDDFVD